MWRTIGRSQAPPGRLPSHRARTSLRSVTVLTSVLVASAIAPSAQAFQLGLQDGAFGQPANAPAAYRELRTIDGNWVRQAVPWNGIAPAGRGIPAGFDPANPADPHYSWDWLDAVVRDAASRHVRLILDPVAAPAWAEGPNRPDNRTINPGAWDPDPAQFGLFIRAAAIRYSGHFPDPLHSDSNLPRVKYWEIWNEENLPTALAAPNLVAEYRALLSAAYGAIKSVNTTDVVAIGGLAPVSFIPPLSISPLKFAAELMCLRRIGTAFVRASPCPQRARFDVFADHPYSLAATPTKHAYRYDDVLIGDMAKVAHLLATADRLQTVRPREHHGLWVTEWSWFTNPPNTVVGDSPQTAARYTAYSIYEMWKNGVNLLIWFQIKDPPGLSQTEPGFVTGGGLYASSGRPKLMLRAVEFPFVAGVRRRRGFAWGRAPVPARRLVLIQRRRGSAWVPVASARTASDGTFYAKFRARTNGTYRASVTLGPTSLAYNSNPIPPRRTHAFYSG